jgi:hypothetical protein
MFCIWRFSIQINKDFYFGFFDSKILDYKGFSLGFIKFGYWYDDIPEGLK